MAKIREVIAKRQFKSKTELIDFVMALAHDNTMHKVGKWHDQSWFEKDIILSGVYRTFKGEKGQRPRSSCGPRCMIMAWILQSYGIKSRQIGIFSDFWDEAIYGHQQIEVFNPDTESWELYDPSWKVHFKDVETGRRLSALELCFRPAVEDPHLRKPVLQDVIPSNSDGSLTGWSTLFPFSLQETKPVPDLTKWGAVMHYCFQFKGESYFLINTKRFDLAKKWH